MSIRFDVDVQGDVLVVRAIGEDGTLDEVNAYGLAVLAKAIEAGTTRVLCDERELHYRLTVLETFESAKFMAESIPAAGRVAIVCRPEDAADGAFWETVAVNRGVQVRVTSDLGAARAWLAAGEGGTRP